MKIQTVTVIGATGNMGTKIAGIFASFGAAKVYLVGRNIEKCRAVLPKIKRSVRADSIESRLIPADFSMLGECVAASDLIFDSTAEDFAIKSEVAQLSAKSMKEDAIFCTGSSGLSITGLAECFPDELRSKVFGVHMFNPPYSLTLCELISTKYSDRACFAELRDYLQKTLLRTVVEVKDAPAFLANRIGFQFINRAMLAAEQFKDNGGIDYIDAILGPFTGRSMAPLMTADFVGLDVHKAIVDNLCNNTNDYAHDSFVLPDFARQMISDGRLGRKSGCGLYKTEAISETQKRTTVYDISTGEYRSIEKYGFRFADQMKAAISEGNYGAAIRKLLDNHTIEAETCVSFMLGYIVYSLATADCLGGDLSAADAVMATGFNWCPPIAMCQAFSQQVDIKTLLKERLDKNTLQAVDIDRLFGQSLHSDFDYRMYFRSTN